MVRRGVSPSHFLVSCLNVSKFLLTEEPISAIITLSKAFLSLSCGLWRWNNDIHTRLPVSGCGYTMLVRSLESINDSYDLFHVPSITIYVKTNNYPEPRLLNIVRVPRSCGFEPQSPPSVSDWVLSPQRTHNQGIFVGFFTKEVQYIPVTKEM